MDSKNLYFAPGYQEDKALTNYYRVLANAIAKTEGEILILAAALNR